jgi:hypothetical protein
MAQDQLRPHAAIYEVTRDAIFDYVLNRLVETVEPFPGRYGILTAHRGSETQAPDATSPLATHRAQYAPTSALPATDCSSAYYPDTLRRSIFQPSVAAATGACQLFDETVALSEFEIVLAYISQQIDSRR